MYFTFFWMDRWLKLMEACTAEQVRLLEASEQSKPGLDEEMARLRSDLAEREQALSVVLQERHELEAHRALAQQECSRLRAELTELRAAADHGRKGYDDRLTELTRAAEDSERQLEREQTARSKAQAELDRMREQLGIAKGDRASAQQECSRLRAEVTGLRAAAEHDRKGYDDRLAELTRAAENSERQLWGEQTARSKAHAELDRLREQLGTAEAHCASVQQESSRLQAELTLLRGTSKEIEAERAAAQNDVERLQHQLTEALAETDRDRKNYEARLAAVNRQLAERDQRAARHDSLPDASDSGRRAKSRTRATNAVPAIVESEPARPVARSVESVASDLELHFKKPTDWAEPVFIYYWDTDPPTEKPQWPGVPLAAEADGWLVHRFPRIRSAHLVFNDNAGKQTRNLYRNRSGWLDADETWRDGKTFDAGIGAAPTK